MTSYLRDLRLGARALRATPGFTAAAVLTLGIGMGAVTAVWSVVDRVLVAPLPFTDPDRLVVVRQESRGAERGVVEWSHPDFLDLREQARAFEDVAAVPYTMARYVWGDDRPEPVQGAFVSWNLFPLLGVRPALGRPFAAEDDRAGAEDVVLLGDGVWRRRFGADPGVVGRTVTLNARSYRVVGVLPPAFAYPPKAEVWVPAVPAVDSLAGRGRWDSWR